VKSKYLLRVVLSIVILLPIAGVVAQIERPRPTPRLTTDEVTRRKGSSSVVVSEEPASDSKGSRDTELRSASRSINWSRSLRDAIQIAKDEDKLIVVDVYTDWCGWCKKMDTNIYANPVIVGLSQQEVFLKLNAEDGDEGQEFARRMGVRGFPTTIVLNEKGNPVAAQRGYISSPQAFIDLVERARQAN
jgi:thiol:disulfide interchange protein